jgi:hypothetical protein
MDLAKINLNRLTSGWEALGKNHDVLEIEASPGLIFIVGSGDVAFSIVANLHKESAAIDLTSETKNVYYECAITEFPNTAEEAFAALFFEATHAMQSASAENNPQFVRANRNFVRAELENFYRLLR